MQGALDGRGYQAGTGGLGMQADGPVMSAAAVDVADLRGGQRFFLIGGEDPSRCRCQGITHKPIRQGDVDMNTLTTILGPGLGERIVALGGGDWR